MSNEKSFFKKDPSNDATYVFLKNFVKEIIDVFPDKYVHLGKLKGNLILSPYSIFLNLI